MTHGLDHAIHGCECVAAAIEKCVVCGESLQATRDRYIDTCSARCFKRLLKLQRKSWEEDR